MKLYLNKYLTCLSVYGIVISETRKNNILERRYNMDLHYDRTTGKVNEFVEKGLVNAYRQAIEKITNYLSLELFSMEEEIPSDVFDKAHEFISDIRADFISRLRYYYSHYYITSIDFKKILKSFNESIAQLEDIYLYRTIYKKSSFHLY